MTAGPDHGSTSHRLPPVTAFDKSWVLHNKRTMKENEMGTRLIPAPCQCSLATTLIIYSHQRESSTSTLSGDYAKPYFCLQNHPMRFPSRSSETTLDILTRLEWSGTSYHWWFQILCLYDWYRRHCLCGGDWNDPLSLVYYFSSAPGGW